MNIFFLDKTPDGSAEMLCDKHVPKMLLESAQMLSTAVRKYEKETNTTPLAKPIYKSAYPNHPMTIWVSETLGNFILEHEDYIKTLGVSDYELTSKRFYSKLILEDYNNSFFKLYKLKLSSSFLPP